MNTDTKERVLRHAKQMLKDSDMCKWSDAHDAAVIEAIDAFLYSSTAGQGSDPTNPKDDSDRFYTKPMGYVAAAELNRLHSGHDGTLRSAKFGPSQLDGDVPVYLEDALNIRDAKIAALTREAWTWNQALTEVTKSQHKARELIAKWRHAADHLGLKGLASLADCADELEAALSASGATPAVQQAAPQAEALSEAIRIANNFANYCLNKTIEHPQREVSRQRANMEAAILALATPAQAETKEPEGARDHLGRMYALIEAVRLMRRGQREYWKRNFSPEESMALEAAEEEVDGLLDATPTAPTPAEAKEPELTVTACYFPHRGEADLTWERGADHFAMTVKVTPEQGRALANTVWPCINWTARAEAPAGQGEADA